MLSDKAKETRKNWYKNNTEDFRLRLNKPADNDVIEKLKEQENRTEYIRYVIRKDIREGK